jgi:hypothetical protein
MQVMIVRDAPYMDSQITVGGLLQLSSVINDGVIQVIENPVNTIIERCPAPGFYALAERAADAITMKNGLIQFKHPGKEVEDGIQGNGTGCIRVSQACGQKCIHESGVHSAVAVPGGTRFSVVSIGWNTRDGRGRYRTLCQTMGLSCQ